MKNDPDYSRFTGRARKVMKLADEEAARLNHVYFGTGHVLLGLAKEGPGLAACVLMNVGAGYERLRNEVDKLAGAETDPLTIENRPHVPRVRKLIDVSWEECCNLDHHYVGTEHLLLGLLRDEETVGARILMNMGLKLEDLRREVLNILGHEI